MVTAAQAYWLNRKRRRARNEGVGVAYDPNKVLRDFSAIVAANSADTSMAILGTSIGNEAAEWVRKLDPYWSAFASNYLVRNALYNDGGSVYAADRMTGASRGAQRFADNFNRADGAVGVSSGGGSYGTVTAWAISGNKVVQNTFSNSLVPSADLPNDKHIIEIDHYHGSDTTSSTGGRIYGLYTSTSAAIFASIQHNGTIQLTYQPGAVALGTSLDIGADLTNGELVHMKLVIDADWLQFEATRGGTTYYVTARLSSAQKTALTGRKFAITGATNLTGIAWDDLVVGDIAQTRRLNIWNASISGSKLSDHVTKIANTIGSAVVGTLDMVLIEPMSHNAGTDSPSTFLSGLDSLIAAVVGQQPAAKIGLLMENPQASPSTTIAEHAARIAALPGYAAANGFGLIDAFNGFDTANLLSDGLGLHPNGVGSDFIALKAAQGFGLA